MQSASALGVGADAFADFAYTMQVSTKGLSQEAAKEAIQKGFEGMGNAFAGLMPEIDKYTRNNEEALDALTRLSTSLIAVNDNFDLLGRKLYDTSIVGADMASNLVDSFGGLDAMNSAVGSYFSAFYSEAERSETILRRLREEFRKIGVAMPESRAAFREIVDGIDLTTEAGRDLYAGMLGLAGAMSEVLPAVSGFTMAMQGLIDQIGGEIGLQIDAAREMAQITEKSARLWYQTAETLRDFLSDLLNTDLTAASRLQAQAVNRNRFESAFDMARGGDVEAARDIPGLAKDYLAIVRANAQSDLEYRRIAAQVQSQVNFLSGISELEGANDDIMRGLYEQQIEVLTGLGKFLKLEGLTDDQVGQLSDGVKALAEDWDGTVGAFQDSLGALEDAIKSAEAFSYDDLVGRLDVAVSLSDNTPAWVRELVDKADTGIRTTLDFIIRKNDLTPDMRWIAVNSVSEHIKSLDFVLRNDVPAEFRRLTLDAASSHTREIALVLSNKSPDGIARLLDLVNPDGGGKIVLSGGISFAPEDAFKTWYSDRTQALISNPMGRLSSMLDALRAEVVKDREQREAEIKRQQDIARITGVGNLLSEQLAGSQANASDLIGKIKSLEASTRVDIRDGDSDALLSLNNKGGIAYRASHVAYSKNSDLGAFRDAFWANGGFQDQIFATNRKIYQQYDQLEALRKQIRDMGAVPGFASGGLHMGGWRIVGERGPELEATGPSRIHSASALRGMLGNDDVVEELRILRREIAEMRRETRRADFESVRAAKEHLWLARKADEVGVKVQQEP